MNYALTDQLLDRFKHSQIVQVEDYKHIFSRSRQHFQTQKKSTKLILAVKKDQFLYEGSSQVQDMGHQQIYYNSLMLNCLYNCDYCYLQGMYPSANIVVFVNLEDFFSATKGAIEQRDDPLQPLYLCISYDTDLLAFEKVVPYCAGWIEFAKSHPEILIELRTKSGLYSAIQHLKPTDNVILAWTLSPELIYEKYEHGTPPLSQRVNAANQAMADGWSVRLCFDPILAVKDWQKIYDEFIPRVFEDIDADKVLDATVGVFRMNRGFYDRIKKQRGDLDLLFFPYQKDASGVSYQKQLREQMAEFVKCRLLNYIPAEKIAVWA